MAELRPTDHYAKIIWLGKVPLNRANIRAQSVQQVQATYAGFEDDYHGGLTRASCVRVRDQHPKGTEIRNTRQLSILSAEELAEIASDIGLETLDPALLGASMVIEGIADFTFVPPGSRLQTASGTTIVIDVENGPCNLPAKEIEKDAAGHGKAFKAAARGKRGVTAWIERTGTLSLGDELRLHVPDQRAWAGA
jgi:MOSC domain-containing protein YiiM